MILGCPSCDAKFKIPAGALAGGGRKVRCANCQHTWHATEADSYKPQQILLSSAIDDDPTPEPIENTPEPVSVENEPEQNSDAEINQADGDNLADHQEAEEFAKATPAVIEEEGTDQTPVEQQATDFIANIKAGLEGSDIEDDFATVDDDLEEEDFLARRRAEQRKEFAQISMVRKRRFVTLGWALLIVIWVSIIAAFAFFKDSVVSLFPAANAVYSSVENADYTDQFRPEDGETLTPPITEEVTRLEAYILPPPTLETIDGEQTLIVRGYVENKGRRAASVPKLELQVVDNRGRVVQNWVHDPKGSIITRGAKLNFESTLSPVPRGVVRAVVKVIEGSKSSGRAEYS